MRSPFIALAALVAFLATLVVGSPAFAGGKKSATIDGARAAVQIHAAKPTPRRTERAPAAPGIPAPRISLVRVPEPIPAPNVAPKKAPSPTRARADLMVFLN